MTAKPTDPAPGGQARRPGRPRSERAKLAVLRAAGELLAEVGLRGMTTDGIAARSGTSKATIYKWWPNKYSVAAEAFLAEMPAGSADPDTGSAAEDLRIALRAMIRFCAGPSGRVFAQLVTEAQHDSAVAAELRDHLAASRRRLVRVIWDRGVARGELAADIDPEVGIDLIFGPALYRLVAGHAPLTEEAADALAGAALRGLRAPRTA